MTGVVRIPGAVDEQRHRTQVVWATDPDAADHGYFGPESMAWQVLAHPAVAVMIAQITNLLEVPHVDFQSVLLDHDPLYPTNDKRQRGAVRGSDGRFHDRIRRTVAVPFPILFGDRSSAQHCARKLFNYHRPMHGTDTDHGTTYAATAPDTMLFAATTIAHGGLLAYEHFAVSGLSRPRRLPDEQRDQYFSEMVELAVLMGVPRDDVPASARQVADYYASLAHKFTYRAGWGAAQRRTALALLRPTGLRDLRRLLFDAALMSSSVLAAAALPTPSRRLNRIPLVADPFLLLARLAGLPLFALLQISAVGRRVRGALIGADYLDAVEAVQASTRKEASR